jgi:CTP:molybdopterin cytidylyltransferase MocA
MIAAALVLAAGRGTRMGGPKALLRLDGELLLASHVRRSREACPRVLVIVPSALVEELSPLIDARVLGAETPSQAHTLRVALRALEAEAPIADDDRLLVTPVDLRPPSLATLRALVAANADAACPAHHGRPGHPVLVRRRLLAPYLAGGEPPRLDALVAGLRVVVPCEDRFTVEDFDTPADLRG